MVNADSERVPRPYPAEKARQGEIILTKRRQRGVFIAGLAGAILFALFMSIAIGLMH